MPTVEFQGETVECETGETLRDVLLDADLSPHNGPTAVSCHGLSTCGTCAVAIEGTVEPSSPGARERARLKFPPHSLESGLRLACQVRVTDDIVVRTGEGFWGQK
ncbi:2Fe-2S iron-sulfur cluster binding domain-containing protein [Haloarchaeobius sp. FL176]|uniref:2Fe-2S iron-sulfur cluster binding domain-containing protein n=1 Tax=Haloarchaeobius sp. FL176 TaxID=2967129 RepID=UPI00214787F2|nr:2Fe-2S iron-sulfur cluster binding domain-containing protein [Haloarchaeobius sp. FL176]